MILVDSSGWIEFFTSGPLADQYDKALAQADGVVVPTVVLYDAYKILSRNLSQGAGLDAVAGMREGLIVALDEPLALQAADLSLEHGLPMADAIVYASARAHGATLVTSDDHFAGLPGVEYLPKAP